MSQTDKPIQLLRVVGQFGLDCNTQGFGIPKGFNLVAVGELRDAHGWRINILVDPEGSNVRCKCRPQVGSPLGVVDPTWPSR
jgi:hypothetical protein